MADPIGQPLEEVRRIRGDITARLKALCQAKTSRSHEAAESDLENRQKHIDLEVVIAGPNTAFDVVDLLDKCRSTPAIIDSIDAAMGDAQSDLNGHLRLVWLWV